MTPVLAPGVDASIIKGPLSSTNALSCESRSQIHQLIDEISSQLNIRLESAANYQEYVDAIVTYRPEDYQMQSHCIDKQRDAVEQLRHQTHTSVPTDVFLKIREKAKQEWPNDFQMRLHTENKQLEAYRKLHQKK
jgi:hypothetical protein